MKRVLFKSVYDAFDYVMEHYYPYGQRQLAQRTDSYAVISIQDTHTDGFGFEFTENEFCKGVLTLFFDDIVQRVEGAKLFSEEDAEDILDFLSAHKTVETLLIHCYGGESRSRAVAAWIVKHSGGDPAKYFQTGQPNLHVYETLEAVWQKRMRAK